MKFACDRCGRKYLLADEKVAAKQDVRLKCRGCGDVIVVKQAGEIVARSLATPIPRLPLAEGALPPPAMPPQFKRASGRAAPMPSSSEQAEEPASLRVSAAELSVSGPVTLRSSPGEGTSEVDPHSETIMEPMHPSGGVSPRPSFPRPGSTASKRASAPLRATPSAKSPAVPATDAEQGPSEQESAGAKEDRDATIEPVRFVAISRNEPAVLGTQGPRAGDRLASVVQVASRLWLGASSREEKRRMLIALGVGFVLGVLLGLVF